ncbi:hypothetical protein NP493_123g02042 [Ridgeia piscesae]|uniref:G-protein coupled receptors family 1 profile domain-containing protein n=1 Tax=Ridgeia piscesae TaxID=27915 RepID=A0AAD9UGM1_RIDPI|nr:hypothetical protein NP493_123g02042 [Ridgeia piscesae]
MTMERLGSVNVTDAGLVNSTTMDCLGGVNSSGVNCTPTAIDVSMLLQEALGQRYRNAAESASLTIVYCAIFLTGLVGNVCTCVVIVSNVHMHTATNYYLFTLAISDVVTLVLGEFRLLFL